MEKDKYDGRFLIDEKMEDVVRDVLVVLEKWQLRTLEQQIVLSQVDKYIQNQIMQKKAMSKEADFRGFVNKWSKKLGVGDEDGQI